MIERLILIRHGDKDTKDAKTTLRAHDPHLTALGLERSVKVGESLQGRLGKDEAEIEMFVSPLIRTVETAREVLKGLGSGSKQSKKSAAKGANHNLVGGRKYYVNLEPGFAEDARAMRRWMLGHHKKMNNTKHHYGEHGEDEANLEWAGRFLPDGRQRSVELCMPVLPTPAQSSKVLLPFVVNRTYVHRFNMEYDNEGYETQSGERIHVQDRIDATLDRCGISSKAILETKNKGSSEKPLTKTVIIVAHEGPIRRVIESLTKPPEPKTKRKVELNHVFMLEVDDKQIWRVVDDWFPEASV